MRTTLSVLLAVAFVGCQRGDEAAKIKELETDKQKISYSIGINLGKSLKKDSVDVDLPIMLRGVKDGLGDTAGRLLNDDEVMKAMSIVQQDLMKKQFARAQAKGAENRKAGEVFLEGNKKRQGVVALPSGLQYEILKQGSGKKPRADQRVVAHYRGTLIDGTEFDDSYKRGQPATFPVRGVIPGWTEALPMMSVGSKWKLYIPPELAYGDRGAGETIPPGSTLVFEVELLGIQ